MVKLTDKELSYINLCPTEDTAHDNNTPVPVENPTLNVTWDLQR